jgi:hypothetical protein
MAQAQSWTDQEGLPAGASTASNADAIAEIETDLGETNTAVTKLQAAKFSGDNADLSASQAAGDFSFYLDDTIGAAVLHIVAKDAAGTVVGNATLTLA